MFKTSTARIGRIAFVQRRFTSSLKEGTVAQSREFGRKEKAHEDEYIHRQELERLKKMKEELEAHKKQLEEFSAEVDQKIESQAKKTK